MNSIMKGLFRAYIKMEIFTGFIEVDYLDGIKGIIQGIGVGGTERVICITDLATILPHTGVKDSLGNPVVLGDKIKVREISTGEVIHEGICEYGSYEGYPAFDIIPPFDEELNSFSSLINSNEYFVFNVAGNIHGEYKDE